MSEIVAEVSRVINAPSDRVYGVLADYTSGHPAILPKAFFTGLTVIEGGRGEGTIIAVGMKVMGVERRFEFQVTEPEPGRVLMEASEAAGVQTRFIVDPVEGGRRSHVTIATRARASRGLMGFVERLVNPSITRRIYTMELDNLEAVARSGSDRRAYHHSELG